VWKSSKSEFDTCATNVRNLLTKKRKSSSKVAHKSIGNVRCAGSHTLKGSRDCRSCGICWMMDLPRTCEPGETAPENMLSLLCEHSTEIQAKLLPLSVKGVLSRCKNHAASPLKWGAVSLGEQHTHWESQQVVQWSKSNFVLEFSNFLKKLQFSSRTTVSGALQFAPFTIHAAFKTRLTVRALPCTPP
jgi:hypothetical protein